MAVIIIIEENEISSVFCFDKNQFCFDNNMPSQVLLNVGWI